MGIDVPELDDTEYDELLSRATKLISAYSDEWTDLNPHDPGVTILEVLAWLTETHIYELDQITNAHRKKYLQLMGEAPAPPQPAEVQLTLSPAVGQTGRLPAETRLTVADGSGTDKQFETDRPTTLTDSTLSAIVVDHKRGQETYTEANTTDAMFYRAFGDNPVPGSVLGLGFDGDPFESTEKLSLFVDFHDADLPDRPTSGDGVSFDPSVELVWECCRAYRKDKPIWEPLAVSSDTTNSLYETGFVTLERPPIWRPTQWGAPDSGLFGHQPGLIWLRCRVVTGGYEIPPQLNSIELNVVNARHRRRHTAQLDPKRQESVSLAPRTYQFDHAPVLSATVSVDGEQWTEVEDFDASGPNETHYVLDTEAGELTFGDETTGKRPPADATVEASYVAGGGADGNVSAISEWWFSDDDQPLGDRALGDIDITPRKQATGGRDAESIESAADRIKRDLRTPSRAVTESDYAAVAEQTPGVRIARTTMSMTDTGQETQPKITVRVVPYAPPDVSKPYPSSGFCDAVQRQLDSHRLLTDRVTVEPPTYVGLDITVSVTVLNTYTSDGHVSAIETRLESYLDPIRGFEGAGWPFGRSVSTDELRQQLETLDTVNSVENISLRAIGDVSVDPDETIQINDQTLFYIEGLQIDATVRDPSLPMGGS